jgi:hypothetical protein
MPVDELFESRLERFEDMIGDVLTILHGDKNLRLVGLNDKIDSVKNEVVVGIEKAKAEITLEIVRLTSRISSNEMEVAELKAGNNKWKYMFWGAAIGAIMVLSIIFGLTLKELRGFIK